MFELAKDIIHSTCYNQFHLYKYYLTDAKLSIHFSIMYILYSKIPTNHKIMSIYRSDATSGKVYWVYQHIPQ